MEVGDDVFGQDVAPQGGGAAGMTHEHIGGGVSDDFDGGKLPAVPQGQVGVGLDLPQGGGVAGQGPGEDDGEHPQLAPVAA